MVNGRWIMEGVPLSIFCASYEGDIASISKELSSVLWVCGFCTTKANIIRIDNMLILIAVVSI